MFCPDCSQDPSEAGASHLPPGNFAGFWRRFVAFCIIDFIIYYTFVKGTQAIIEFIIQTKEGPLGFLIIIVYLGSPWLYFAYMESSPKQATLGKKALGIKVTDIKGAPISFVRATARYFGKFFLLTILVIGTERHHINFQGFGRHSVIICVLIFFIGFSMAVLTPKKQTIYDIMAGTLVVKKEPPLEKTNAGSPHSEVSQSTKVMP